MTDLGNRFASGEGASAPRTRPDDLDRLRQPAPDHEPGVHAAGRWIDFLKNRTDLLVVACAFAVAAFVAWPQIHPADIRIPPIAETGEEVATIKVHPLWDNGSAVPPDWYGLFNTYQLETSLRDISIRCNYSLPADARVDRYLHARLETGTEVRIFLADPGICPKT